MIQLNFIEKVLGCSTSALPDYIGRMDEVNAAFSEALGNIGEAYNSSYNSSKEENGFMRFLKGISNSIGAIGNSIANLFRKQDTNDLISRTRDIVTRNFGDRNAITDIFRSRKTTAEFLVSEGYLNENDINNDEKVKAAFMQYSMAERPSSDASVKEKQQYMNKMKTLLSDTIRATKNSDNPEELKYIAFMINTIAAGDRERAAEILISECGDNLQLTSTVSYYLFTETLSMACSADAMGNFMSNQDQIKLSACSASHMLEDDHRNAVSFLNANFEDFLDQNPDLNIEKIRSKAESGEPLTPAEMKLLAYSNQYAGSSIGTYINEFLDYELFNYIIEKIYNRDILNLFHIQII